MDVTYAVLIDEFCERVRGDVKGCQASPGGAEREVP